MEKKFKFSDKPALTKFIYGAVIAILCITAIVIGIVSASNKAPDDTETPNPPVSDGNGDGEGDGQNPPQTDDKPEEKLTFTAPMVGEVTKGHSLTAPVFSLTLGEWRVHTGLDISCEEGASVYASEDGEITGIYSDPMLGYTVEITHSDEIKTRYSNLDGDSLSELKVGDKVTSGDKIGTVGDSSISELAEEPHLHFEMIVTDTKVNPLDYISEESKKASFGIGAEEE
ncbi:MAG: M23 family metallopeptidase [Clostridia bacterium]|nr:M23 family metallopeptidase [Clostridia bacterium]